MFVDFLPERETLEPVAFVGDDGRRATIFKESTKFCTVIGFVSQQLLCGGYRFDERLRDRAVIDLAARQQEGYRPAFAIRERVDFGRAAAPADAERLTPFLPCAERCALIAVESMLFS